MYLNLLPWTPDVPNSSEDFRKTQPTTSNPSSTDRSYFRSTSSIIFFDFTVNVLYGTYLYFSIVKTSVTKSVCTTTDLHRPLGVRIELTKRPIDVFKRE